MDNNFIMAQLPPYTNDIISKVSGLNWFIHYFNLDDEQDIYSIGNYIHNNQLHDVNYIAILDSNVYQFVLNAYKKSTNKPEHRNAIALLVFCRITDINFDTTYPVYEKLNYGTKKIAKVLDDLELFRNMDNADIDQLAMYALNKSNSFSIPNTVKINKQQLKTELTKYRRLTNWDSFYLFILVITSVSHNKQIKNKLEHFIKWMLNEFFFSLIAITYAIVFFGKKPLPKMMKYKDKMSSENKEKSITNMTWDLFHMQAIFERWKKKTATEEFIFISDDKAFSELLRLAISIQNKEGIEHLSKHISEEDIAFVNKFTNQTYLASNERTQYMANLNAQDRSVMIQQYEDLLFA
ncbi:hypothetical protein [Colwellia sp. UCD-KL20]|uniref:hypothetical protein n=1 Tax=Colwellia sp. UCD-KL20 TaxID=1917165 RepID=UPI001178C2FC|nr:hypothetical protein [Colwellia sp. UCD-KL20]